jgi:hypothetical protein
MYITTSRKPSDATRKLARLLSNFLGIYENRGKKSIADIVTRADELGYSRVVMLSERRGNPDSLSFIKVAEEWSWMDPEIMISVKQPTPEMSRIKKQAKYIGDEKYSDLFDLQEPDTDDIATVKMDDKRISLSYNKSSLVLNIKGLRRLKVPEE